MYVNHMSIRKLDLSNYDVLYARMYRLEQLSCPLHLGTCSQATKKESWLYGPTLVQT